ncbi:MAG: hypothetical protein HKM07_05930 [Chlamydiae bacterium]|nr:hypothetical protein [Chlamydiota bacterium]
MADIDPISSAGKIPPPQPKSLEDKAVSPFKKMLGPAATDDDVKRFINQSINDLLRQMRKDEQKWKESMRKMREGE